MVGNLEENAVPDTSTQVAFRQLRQELEDEGWWERDMGREYRLLGIWGALVAGATVTAHSVPLISIFLLGLSMTAAGWLGHDYIHGVDPFADRFRNFAALAAGLCPTWWSDKHNKHHALSKCVYSFLCLVMNISHSKVLILTLLFFSGLTCNTNNSFKRCEISL